MHELLAKNPWNLLWVQYQSILLFPFFLALCILLFLSISSRRISVLQATILRFACFWWKEEHNFWIWEAWLILKDYLWQSASLILFRTKQSLALHRSITSTALIFQVVDCFNSHFSKMSSDLPCDSRRSYWEGDTLEKYSLKTCLYPWFLLLMKTIFLHSIPDKNIDK